MYLGNAGWLPLLPSFSDVHTVVITAHGSTGAIRECSTPGAVVQTARYWPHT